eukprot:gene17623-biopygen2343
MREGSYRLRAVGVRDSLAAVFPACCICARAMIVEFWGRHTKSTNSRPQRQAKTANGTYLMRACCWHPTCDGWRLHIAHPYVRRVLAHLSLHH